MKNVSFLSENFQFLELKFSVYLNRRVFVMLCTVSTIQLLKNHKWEIILCVFSFPKVKIHRLVSLQAYIPYMLCHPFILFTIRLSYIDNGFTFHAYYPVHNLPWSKLKSTAGVYTVCEDTRISATSFRISATSFRILATSFRDNLSQLSQSGLQLGSFHYPIGLSMDKHVTQVFIPSKGHYRWILKYGPHSVWPVQDVHVLSYNLMNIRHEVGVSNY